MTELQPNDPRLRWLDMALEGEPPEVKARVLQFILHYQVDPESEFFQIFCAMGQLISLTETAPEEFQSVFRRFADELSQWSLQTLDVMERKAQTTADLAALLQGQNSIFKELISTLIKQTSIWQRGVLNSDSFLSRFDSTNNRLDSQLGQLLSKHDHLAGQLTAWRATATSNAAANWNARVLAFGFGLLVGAGATWWLAVRSPDVEARSPQPQSVLTQLPHS